MGTWEYTHYTGDVHRQTGDAFRLTGSDGVTTE